MRLALLRVRALGLAIGTAVVAAAVVNYFSCIGNCEPAPGAAGALELPLAVLYAAVTGVIVLIAALTATRTAVIPAAVVSTIFSAIAAWLFYHPSVDSMFGLAMWFVSFFFPWFIGGYVAARMWPNKQFQPTGLASGSAGG